MVLNEHGIEINLETHTMKVGNEFTDYWTIVQDDFEKIDRWWNLGGFFFLILHK